MQNKSLSKKEHDIIVALDRYFRENKPIEPPPVEPPPYPPKPDPLNLHELLQIRDLRETLNSERMKDGLIPFV
jgi:hypothetical protein